MHRNGHTGIVLLALAPVLYVLMGANRPLLAGLAFSVLVIEPLPDYDQRTSLLTHRGISHSFLAAVLVGLFCGLLGWLADTYVIEPLAAWLETSSWPKAAEISGQLALNALPLALTGFLIGSGGIVLHLLGDVITAMGIKPLRPFSNRTVSLTPLRANNSIVNYGLFLLGVLAIGVVGYTLLPISS